MKFEFIGDPRRHGDGPRVMTAFGVAFPRGEAIEVEDARVARKLEANSHFRVVEEEPKGTPEWTKDSLEAYAMEKHGVNLDRRKSLERLIAEVEALDNGVHEG